MSDWDYEVDVLVVGSGAGGMTSAIIAHDLGLSALIIEKTDKIGGTSAVSGGGIWAPCNHLMRQYGQSDSFEEALTYMKATVGADTDEKVLQAFIHASPVMVKYLEDHSRIHFAAVSLPDYRAEEPGAKDGYRNLEAEEFDAALLGADLDLIRRPHPQSDMTPMFTLREGKVMLNRMPGAGKIVARQMVRYLLDFPWRMHSRRSRRLTLGIALMARCYLSAKDRDIPLLTDTPMTNLISENGRVIGVEATHEGKPIRIKARKGVIIAAGGFNHNAEMRAKYMPHSANTKWSVAPIEALTGDGINAGIKLGAATRLMDESWWIPSFPMPNSKPTRGMFAERSYPGSIIVDQNAQRYFNESINYDDAGRAMIEALKQGRPVNPSYFVFDGTFRKNYIAGPLMPGRVQPDWMVGADAWSVVVKASSLDELAVKLELDPAALQKTVDRHNGFARSGKDEDFGRGEGKYDRFYSDLSVKPNSNLAPIERAPFYAIKIFPGDLGTKGGLLIDNFARVLNTEGAVIEGLYAIGNSSASIMGHAYPGGGSTIGASMTYGFIAAQHIAGKTVPTNEGAVNDVR